MPLGLAYRNDTFAHDDGDSDSKALEIIKIFLVEGRWLMERWLNNEFRGQH
ncbi:MAG: hypothetical protein WBZ42_05695 [Halobacteriota archaeon]